MNAKTNAPEIGGWSPLAYARTTGVVGVTVLVTGSFSNYVGSKLIVRGDAVATSGNILASESLFRLGVVSSLIMILTWLLYALALYRLLKPVNKGQAQLMIVLVLVCVPVFMLNQLNLFAALPLAKGGMPDQMMFFLNQHRHGNIIAAIFFGLWLFPLGLLVFRSGYLPRIIGVLLMIGCFGYLILFFQSYLFPGSEATLWTNPPLVVTHLAELSLMLWLLIRGVNVEQWERRVRERA